jgi:hypothetical protein
MNKATGKLLALLEERGVTPKMIPFELDAIAWQGDICKWVAVYDEDEEAFAVAVYENYLSAEQAIVATLGSGTCDDLGGIGANGKEVFHCSKCGCILSLFDSDDMNTLCTSFICDYPRFCPECGRKVVSA